MEWKSDTKEIGIKTKDDDDGTNKREMKEWIEKKGDDRRHKEERFCEDG